MTFENFAELYSNEPFRPFTLCLADTRELPVLAFDVLTLGNDTRTISVYVPAIDALELIDLDLVVSARLWEPAAAPDPGTGALRL